MKKILVTTLIIVGALYIIVCTVLFFLQEKLIFLPQKLDKHYKFRFEQDFEELNIKTADNKLLNVLLFKANDSKGVIFYLHGNAGSLSSWGDLAKTYTDLHYDVFMMDYRGYGKSEGSINGQKQLFQDVQTAYEELKNRYAEDKIIVLGYSLGTGLAAKVASTNHPKLLILQSPYYSLSDMIRHTLRIIPTFILKYKLKTGDYIKHCKMRVIIFHGDQDEVIYYGSALKLKAVFKKQDTLITLVGQGHNGITENPDYRREIQKILGK